MNKLGLIELRNSSLELHSADLANFGRSQTISLVSRPKFAKNYESQTENPSVVVALPRIYESKRESAIFRHCEANHRFAEAIQSKNQSARSANPCKSFCYFLLSQKVESPLPLNPNLPSGANLQNLAQKSVESSLDSTLSTQETNSSIFDEKSGLRSCERGNRTNGSLTKRTTSLPDLSQKDAEFVRLWV